MVDIILMVVGIIILVKGNVKVTSKTELSKPAARIIGIIFVVPFFLGFLIGFLDIMPGGDARTIFLVVEEAIVIIAALVIAIFFRKPIQ